MIKSLSPSNRFSLFCFIFIAAACAISAAINIILRYAETTHDSLLSSIDTLTAIPASFIYVLLLILPGAIISEQLIRRDLIKRKHLLLVSISLGAVLAYLIFWVYFLNHIAGRIVSLAVLISCIFIFLYKFKIYKEYIFDSLFIKPLTIFFIVGCLYSGILLLYTISGDVNSVANSRFLVNLPADNIIPRWVFELAYHGQPLHMLGDYWYVTDRPPLMAAILAFLFPLNIFNQNVSAFHQFFGSYIQLLWIPALYYMCDFLSFSGRVRIYTIFCAVFSGVFLMNSLFIWPKLMTTIFFCLVLIFVFELADIKKNTKKAAVYSIMIGIAAVMTILSHGSSMFSFIALGLAIIFNEKRFKYNYRDLLFAFGTFFIIYLPWQLLSSYNSPTGNKLLKVLFAGYEVNDPSLLNSIFLYYTETHIGTLFEEKTANFFRLMDFNLAHYSEIENLRWYAFNQTIGGALVLNLFTVIAALYFLNRFCFKKNELSYKHKIMTWFTILSFFVWPLMVSGGAILYQGSYFNLILLYLVIAYGIKHSNKFIKIPVFISHILIFISAYVFHRNATIGQSISSFNIGMLIVMIVSAALLLIYLYFYDDEKEKSIISIEGSGIGE